MRTSLFYSFPVNTCNYKELKTPVAVEETFLRSTKDQPALINHTYPVFPSHCNISITIAMNKILVGQVRRGGAIVRQSYRYRGEGLGSESSRSRHENNRWQQLDDPDQMPSLRQR